MNDAEKTVIITGGNAGLGYHCAKHIALSNTGWHVLLACRNKEKGIEAVKKMTAETGNANISFMLLDLSSFKSVHDFVKTFNEKKLPPLKGIICNAGISIGDEVTYTAEGIETTFQVNSLGHFLMVHLLLNLLVAPARILFVSSELHRNDGPVRSFRPEYTTALNMAYPAKESRVIKKSESKRYSASKLCLIMYAYEFAKRLQSEGKGKITVNSFNPGLMPDTSLGGLNKKWLQRLFLKYLLPLFAKGALSTPDKSGRILAHLLISADFADVTGKYFDREEIIPSSDESYDMTKRRDLWDTSETLTQLSGDSQRL